MREVGLESKISLNDGFMRSGATPTKPAAEGRGVAATFSHIMAQMVESRSGSKKKSFEDLMQELQSEEDEFAAMPSPTKFESYRKTVRALCDLLLQKGYRLHGWEDRKQRRYEIIKTIDSNLAELYTGLLRRNQDVVIALHLMGQIRGLIFDLQA